MMQQQLLIGIVVQLDLNARVAAIAFVPPVGLGLAALFARSPDQRSKAMMVLCSRLYLMLLLRMQWLLVVNAHDAAAGVL